MDERPEPSDCPLCGAKCRNTEDPDGYETVTCSKDWWICPYNVYQNCHEKICAKVKENSCTTPKS